MGRNNRHDANVIHVVFGPGGGRVQSELPNRGGLVESTLGAKEPLTDLFTCSEISRLIGMSPTRLRSLDRSGVVTPSGRRKGRRAYTFQDLSAPRKRCWTAELGCEMSRVQLKRLNGPCLV